MIRSRRIIGRRFQASSYRLGAFLTLGFVVPIYFVLSTGYTWDNPTNAILLAGLIIYSALFLAINLSSDEINLLDFIIWFFSYLWLGIAPFVQTISGANVTTTLGVDSGLVPEAVGVALLGILAYQLGHHQSKKAPAKNMNRFFGSSISTSRLATIIISSWLVFAIYLGLIGPTNLFLDRESKAIAIASTIESNFLPELLFSLTWTLSVISTISLIQLSRVRGHLNRGFLLVLAGLPALAAANPIASGRYIFLTVYGSIALALAEPVIRKFPQLAKLTLVSSVLVILPLLNAFRRKGASWSIPPAEEYLASGDFDAFSQLVNGIEYLRSTGVSVSNQFLGPLLFFIPRSVWPDKPLDTGRLLGLYKGYTFTNLSAPLWVETLISFSLVGLAIIFYLIGRSFYKFDLRFESGAYSQMPLYFPATIYLVIILRGSLLQASAALVFLILSTFALARLQKTKTEQLSG